MSQYNPAFEIAVERTMRKEGPFGRDPNDPGNWTGGQKGVGVLKGTKRGISAWRYPEEDIENLTDDRIKFLYYRDFWQPLKLDGLKPDRAEIAEEAFDTGVNCGGPFRAAQILQGALVILGHDLAIDGVVGPKTIEAVNNYIDPEALMTWMNVLQGDYYLFGGKEIPELIKMAAPRKEHFQRYARGWAKRLQFWKEDS